MISFPIYRRETGIADLIRRRPAFNAVIQGLESQTSLKNAGRLRRAFSRALQPGLTCVTAIIDCAKLRKSSLTDDPPSLKLRWVKQLAHLRYGAIGGTVGKTVGGCFKLYALSSGMW